MSTPEARQTIEDLTIDRLSDLLVENGGYLSALETYYGPDSPDGQDHFLVHTLNTRTPAILLRCGDGSYDNYNVQQSRADHVIDLELFLFSANYRSPKTRFRGDSNEPGIYQMMRDVRDLLMGHELDGDGIGYATPEGETVVTREIDKSLWRMNFSVDADAVMPSEDVSIDKIRSKVNEPNEPDANPTLETDTDV